MTGSRSHEAANLLHPRDEIMQVMERIYHHRMTTTSGGNLSVREANGDIWITPARVDKGTLRRDDIVCVRADGKVEGRHKPSSEFPFHRAVYEVRPDVRAVVHAHPVALVAASLCRKAPDTRLLYQSLDVCGTVEVARYALPGSAALGEQIARTFRRGIDCVLLENHGVVVGGPSLQHAFQRFETLEFTAKIIIKGSMLGRVRYLTARQVEQARQAVQPLPFLERVSPATDEKELRRQLVEFVRRGCRQRLLLSTGGSFSARLDAEAFLITPHGVDRQTVDLEDIVLVRSGAAEAGKLPSRARHVHAAVYARHPEVQAIANAYPVNATAFSVTNTPLDTRTIPESYVFLRQVGRLPYGVQFSDPDAVARSVSLIRPSVLLENDGALVCGTSVLDAYDRLEVLEATAEAIINARQLGRIAPMGDKAIRDLKRAFFG